MTSKLKQLKEKEKGGDSPFFFSPERLEATGPTGGRSLVKNPKLQESDNDK
jgi:hypothetical protein